MSNRVLNRCFLESVLIKIFTIFNFGNTLAMSIMFYFKMFKLSCRFQKWNKKLRKIFFFADNCICIGRCKFPQHSTGCLPSAVNVFTSIPRFHLTLGETYSKSTCLRMIKEHDKSTLMEILQAVWRLSHVDCQSLFWNGALETVF